MFRIRLRPRNGWMNFGVAATCMMVMGFACNSASNRAEKFAGRWHYTAHGTVYTACPIEITKNGENYIISDLSTESYGTCSESRQLIGIYNVTPEGNLANGRRVLLYDDATSQIVCDCGGLTHFKKAA